MALITLENRDNFTNPLANFGVDRSYQAMSNSYSNLVPTQGNGTTDTSSMPDGRYKVYVAAATTAATAEIIMDTGTWEGVVSVIYGGGNNQNRSNSVHEMRIDKGVGQHIRIRGSGNARYVAIFFEWLGPL